MEREIQNMLDTSARLLALLSLLQSRPSWSGSELAERLEVSGRTIRNDIDRLRELGYPVDATRGSTGHYRLGAGATLPPLLLDDEEAIAVAIGLRAGTGVQGIQDSSARALAKLEQVLPHRLRRKVAAVHSTVSRGPENTDTNVVDPEIDPEVLAALATAIRDTEWVRFEYREEPRVVEPYRLVSWQRRWYLVARDEPTGDWATFRVDWMTLRMATHRAFAPRPMAEGEYTDFVLRDVASTGWNVHASIRVLAPADEVLARINPAVGVVEALDDGTCMLVTGADSYEVMAVYIGMLGMDFRVTSPPELVAHVDALGERYARATS
jgi:predicted DNA-binding transcriptional regulator YafY